jgi:hypothetical protein
MRRSVPLRSSETKDAAVGPQRERHRRSLGMIAVDGLIANQGVTSKATPHVALQPVPVPPATVVP